MGLGPNDIMYTIRCYIRDIKCARTQFKRLGPTGVPSLSEKNHSLRVADSRDR
jgi:hypothetical protein